ncbi:MAG: hypothetical protein AAF840_05130 [Bacteroidota bacterium]
MVVLWYGGEVQLDKPEEMEESLKIGVVGFSRNQFDQEAARRLLRKYFVQLREKHGERVIEIVSGYTAQGVPLIAYKLAGEYGMRTVGFSAKQALRVRAGVFPCNEEIIVGERFGDESEAFVRYIDGLIRIGGGPQSRREVAMFSALHAGPELPQRLVEEEVAWYGK